jgi:hypothetical protein
VGQPVVHFEVVAKDGERAREYYSEPMEGLEIGLFKDPEGNIVGLSGSAG